MLGIKAKIPYAFFAKVEAIVTNLGEFNFYSLLLAVGTFAMCKYLLKWSVYIPAPLLAVVVGVVLSNTVLHSEGLTVSQDKYGPIPAEDFFKFTAPVMPEMNGQVLFDLVYYVLAIVFVAAIESLLCSRMADRMAENKGTPYNPNKELFGQGMVNMLVPLLNGFPHTGALARTATNIKVGGMTPLAGILKCWLKLAMAYFLATHLDQVPMACIGGILAYVAFNMIKLKEIKLVLANNRFHIFLMTWTAVVVLMKDFLSGVLSALVIYWIADRFFPTPARKDVPDADAPDEPAVIEPERKIEPAV